LIVIFAYSFGIDTITLIILTPVAPALTLNMNPLASLSASLGVLYSLEAPEPPPPEPPSFVGEGVPPPVVEGVGWLVGDLEGGEVTSGPGSPPPPEIV
jgi:hypothetical protein